MKFYDDDVIVEKMVAISFRSSSCYFFANIKNLRRQIW
jgi:hypothetical protein